MFLQNEHHGNLIKKKLSRYLGTDVGSCEISSDGKSHWHEKALAFPTSSLPDGINPLFKFDFNLKEFSRPRQVKRPIE